MKKAFTLIIISFLFSGMVQAQEKSTLNVKDLNSNIEKYIKKNFKDYKAVEALKYAAVFEMKAQKDGVSEWLLFDNQGKFLNKETESRKSKMPSQLRTTMAAKDVNKDITKYMKNGGLKISEAYMYEESTEVMIQKGSDAQTLLFDKEGKFIMKMQPVKTIEQPKKADSVPVKKEEPKAADTSKKK